MGSDIQFEFRLAEFDNLLRYQDIVEACFGRRPDEGYFRWKYRENPAGDLIAFEALHEGRVAGFYGVIPWHFDVGGEQRLFYQSMDTMTHPDYQRRGLFVKLANLTYAEVARRQSEHVLVGIPGTTSYPGFVQKLGWLCPFEFSYLFIPRVLFDTLRAFRNTSRLEIRQVTAVDQHLRDYFRSRERNRDVVAPSLSVDFLRWRVLDNPNFSYKTVALHEAGQMIGFAVYRSTDQATAFVEMVDWLSRDRWETSGLAEVVRYIFRDTSARYVFTWEATSARIAAAYRRVGFLRNPLATGPFSYRVPFIFRSPHRTYNDLDLTRRESYDLQPLMQD